MAALDDGWRLYDEHNAGQHTKPVDGCGQCFRALVARAERQHAVLSAVAQWDENADRGLAPELSAQVREVLAGAK